MPAAADVPGRGEPRGPSPRRRRRAIANGDARSDIERAHLDLDDLETEYNDQLAESGGARSIPTDPVTQQLFDQVDVAGQDFWRIYHEQFLPAFESAASKAASMGGAVGADQHAVLAPVTIELTNLNAAFEVHKERVETLVAMAEADLATSGAGRQRADPSAGDAAGLRRARHRRHRRRRRLAHGPLDLRTDPGPHRRRQRRGHQRPPRDWCRPSASCPPAPRCPSCRPLEVHGSEEIKQLSASFESLRNTAVQLAAGESQLRQNVSSMFVNLGRRNQNLLNRTLNFITTLEENERNPETLDNLFRLDHLVTRMRRNAESLLVLAGHRIDPHLVRAGRRGRHRPRRPVGDRGLRPGRHRLRWNRSRSGATPPPTCPTCWPSCSRTPPRSRLRRRRLRVIGKYAHDGYLLSITDNGIGMTQKELRDANERLARVRQVRHVPADGAGPVRGQPPGPTPRHPGDAWPSRRPRASPPR